jgi:hypothetical protein
VAAFAHIRHGSFEKAPGGGGIAGREPPAEESTAFAKEIPDVILKGCHGPGGFYGPEGIIKQLTKALAERTMEAGLAGHPG